MYKTVEKELKRIVKWVEKETGTDISDFLYDAYENYEYNEDGEKATCRYIVNGLWNEADMFVDLFKEQTIVS